MSQASQQSEGKVAVVTGGSAGVGRATVQLLAQEGYDVAVLARGDAGLAPAASDVERAGRRGLPIDVDVSEHDAVTKAAARVERELGPIDAWVNVAFVGTLAYSWDTTPDEYRRVMDVTFHGQVNGTLAALGVMRPRNGGVIVNVGSAMAYRSIPLQAPYCAAKHAVKGFTESVMTELAHEKSKVKLCMVQLPGLNLGRSGVKSQQSSKADARRGPNLWEPRDADLDAGVHGSFDNKAHSHDPVLWAATHRRKLVGGLVAGAAVAMAGAAVAVTNGGSLSGTRG